MEYLCYNKSIEYIPLRICQYPRGVSNRKGSATVSNHTPLKTCTQCKRELPATTEHFHIHKKEPLRLYPKCKACRSVLSQVELIDLENEVWRDVLGYEGLYQVSNLGRIKAVRNRTNTYLGRLLKPKVNKYGYYSVSLSGHGRTTTTTAHKIVAEAFYGKRPEGLVVNHKNGIKTDNRIENLEFVTHKQNINHSYEVLGNPYSIPPVYSGEDHPQSVLTEKEVMAIRILANSNVFSSKDIGQFFGVSKTTVANIVKGIVWKDAA